MRSAGIDWLKLSLAFMVVGLHSQLFYDVNALIGYLAVNGIFRLAVPIFFVINGFYFYSAIINEKFNPWLKRAFRLYLFWMLIYSPYWISYQGLSISTLYYFMRDVLVGYWHLWYVAGMIGAALILYLIRGVKNKWLFIIPVLCFVIGTVFQYISAHSILKNTVLAPFFQGSLLHRNFLFFAFPFFYAGYVINKNAFHEKISKRLAGNISILGVIALLLEAGANFFQNAKSFNLYFSLPIASIFIFIYCYKLNFRGNSKNIALLSSAIYFVHVLFLNIFKLFLEVSPTYLFVLVSAVSLLISWLLVLINRRFKFIL